MALFAISDPHLSLAKPKPMDIFGPEWRDAVAKLEAGLRAHVGPEDELLIPGDISWAMTLEEALPDLHLIHSWPGRRKILLRGNHDYWWQTTAILEKTFAAEGLDDLVILKNNAILSLDEAYIVAGTKGYNLPQTPQFRTDDPTDMKLWNRELGRMRLSLQAAAKLQKAHPQARLVVMTHYPCLARGLEENDYTKLFAEYEVQEVVFGHIHTKNHLYHLEKYVYNGTCYSLVSCDQRDFIPLRLDPGPECQSLSES